ncbi:hypothetical protein C2845_PM14G00980 [Panicum miliaceum]|uniref:Uncharacterized protein n=1 Tax=Panicum miliaceum TaxID=4540 RepID=A0A3L6PS32_PANMI|nr:hypothetical protein C2845_PM14G00980 [Panicum miliaceum]
MCSFSSSCSDGEKEREKILSCWMGSVLISISVCFFPPCICLCKRSGSRRIGSNLASQQFDPGIDPDWILNSWATIKQQVAAHMPIGPAASVMWGSVAAFSRRYAAVRRKVK